MLNRFISFGFGRDKSNQCKIIESARPRTLGPQDCGSRKSNRLRLNQNMLLNFAVLLHGAILNEVRAA